MSVCLGIDASAAESSAAIVIDGVVQAEESASQGTSGETLLGLVHRVIDRAAISVSEIDRIAVGIGPGSFTGIRNGIATAQGFATGSAARKALPVFGISALLALGLPEHPGEYCFVSFPANSLEAFAGIFCRLFPGEAIELSTGALVLPRTVVESYLTTVSDQLLTESRSDYRLCSRHLAESSFHPGLAARTAIVLREVIETNSLGIGDPEGRGDLFQQTSGGRGLRAVYAKPVHAKTLLERGVKTLTSTAKRE